MPAVNLPVAIAEPVNEDTPKEETIKLRVCVFFDGTKNNRTNIDARLVSAPDENLTDEERKTAADLKQKMSLEDIKKAKGIYKKNEGVGSFENGYTNIVKLERHIDTDNPPPDYQLMLKTYIEGPGTRDNKSDKMLGYAIGVGVSGVKKKVKLGINDVVKKVSANHLEKDIMIENLTLDTFGFSRGAAAARSFIHEALLVKNSVEEQLKGKGYKVGKVEVCFTGLYDTVSSHGIDFTNDTKVLNLDAVAHAKEVVHLAAADEHRENFSLTDIKSAGGKGRQIFLPGVHSDVGGSYRDGASEDQDVFWTISANGEAAAEKQKNELVTAGWYKKGDLTIKSSTRSPGGKHTIKEVNLHATRSSISNQYSRIPLHLMARFVRENKIAFNPKLDKDEKVSEKLSTVQQEIQSYVSQHDSPGLYTSKPEHWLEKKDDWIRKLRYDYFHFSARLETGNGPRFDGDKRERQQLDG